MPPNYSGPVLGISGGDPAFRGDDGSADPLAAAALGAFAAGSGGEHAALMALAGRRLLVPVVAVPTGQSDRRGEVQATRGPGGTAAAWQADAAGRAKTSTEMAMPTLIGLDGRRAVPAFTCLDSLRRWRQAARPVPVAASQVWQAAVSDSAAVVIDVAGPVPLAVEGARLAALANGAAVPLPQDDPDVQQAVVAVLAGELTVRGFRLGPGDGGHDLMIGLVLAPGKAHRDVDGLACREGDAIMARLGVRLRRGIAIAITAG